MARNLLRAGKDVTVWNRTEQKARLLEKEGARVAATPVEAVRDAQIVLTMLADAPAVEATVVGSGGLDAMPSGSLWIQSSTIGVGASRGHVWLGEVGLGTRLKLVVNSWILCTMENLAETLVLAETLGVDPRSFLEAISGGGMDMPYAHLKGEAMMNRDFVPSFPLAHARKDVGVILDAAGEVGLPLVRATLRQFDRAFDLGHGDDDMSAVYDACAASAGARS